MNRREGMQVSTQLCHYRIAIKFGGLAVYLATAKLKSANTLYLHIYCMAIPY